MTMRGAALISMIPHATQYSIAMSAILEQSSLGQDFLSIARDCLFQAMDHE
jgi:hypothetical protein